MQLTCKIASFNAFKEWSEESRRSLNSVLVGMKGEALSAEGVHI
jgi:hypothetical protein